MCEDVEQLPEDDDTDRTDKYDIVYCGERLDDIYRMVANVDWSVSCYGSTVSNSCAGINLETGCGCLLSPVYVLLTLSFGRDLLVSLCVYILQNPLISVVTLRLVIDDLTRVDDQDSTLCCLTLMANVRLLRG